MSKILFSFLVTLIFFSVFINTTSFAFGGNPIPNYSFENWGGNPSNPTGWMTSNNPQFQPVTQSSSSVHGNSSAKGEVLTFMGAPIPPFLNSDEFPVNERYGSLSGHYIFLPVGADTFQVNVAMKNGSNIIGGGNIQFINTQSSWTKFFVDIEYTTPDTPTTCIITINLQDIFYGPSTTFFIDELEFGDPELFSTSFSIGTSSVPSIEYSDMNTISEGADDFIIPAGQSWEVGGVKVYGTFSNGANGFQGAIAHIRSDDDGKPGDIIYSDTNTSLNAFFGQNFFVVFKTPLNLNPGRYWLNFYVKMPISPDSSVYAWATSNANIGAPFHWRDPAQVFDTAVNWTPGNEIIVGGGQPDLLFKVFGYQGTVSIQPIGNEIPSGYSLKQNYPNPFNPETTIEFTIPKNDFVNLTVYNSLGKEVGELINENLSAGIYRYNWNASGLTSGVYFCKISTGDFRAVTKMLLVK